MRTLQGTALAQHTNDNTKHITAADRAAIAELQTDLNATENMLVAHAADAVKHITPADRAAIAELQTDLNAAENMLVAHAADGTKHITPAERTTWSGKVGKSVLRTATLTAAGWSGTAAPYSQTVGVTGATATSVNEILPASPVTAAQLEAMQTANIQDGGQAANSVTLKAWGEKPAVDIPVEIIVRGDL